MIAKPDTKKINIGVEELRVLKELALANGTILSWVEIAMEYAEHCSAEGGRLRKIIEKYENDQT